MRKIYSLFLLVMCFMAATQAQARTITLAVDNPDAAYFRNPLNNYEVGTWGDGGTFTFDLTDDITIPIEANQGYELTGATCGEQVIFQGNMSSYSIGTAGLPDGATINITTAEKEPKILKITANAEQVYVITENYQTLGADEQVDGCWTITCTSDWGSTQIYANQGYLMTSVLSDGGTQFLYSSPASSCTISNQQIASGTTEIAVTSAAESEIYDGEATVNVSGPSYMVALRYNEQYSSVSLNEGTNTIHYDSATAFPITIQHAYNSSYNPQTLYSVKVNGEALAAVDGVYTINELANGSVIDIAVNPPTAAINVAVLFADETSKQALTRLAINGDEIPAEQWASFETETGKTIIFQFDYENYDITLTENGSPVSINYGSYSHTLANAEGYQYMVTAAPKQPLTITIVCDNWQHLKVSNSYSGDNPYELTGTETTLTIQPANTYLFFSADTGWRLVGLKNLDTGDDMPTSGYVTDGMNIFADVVEYKRDNHFTLYTEPIEWNYLMFILSPNSYDTRYEFTPEPGYSTIAYAETDKPFTISGYCNAGSPAVYLNGQLAENQYGALPLLDQLVDGDVIKIMSPDAQRYDVSYTIEEPLAVTIKQDKTLLVDPAEVTQQFSGTEIEIIPAQDEQLVVKANETELTANDEGHYVFTVTDAAVAFDIAKPQSGILDVAADAAAGSNLYNLQGILILRDATTEAIKALPAGIYVMNGKKIVVK